MQLSYLFYPVLSYEVEPAQLYPLLPYPLRFHSQLNPPISAHFLCNAKVQFHPSTFSVISRRITPLKIGNVKYDGKRSEMSNTMATNSSAQNKFSKITALLQAHGMEDKPFFRCIRTSLRSIVKNEAVIEKLANAALLTNRIMSHSLHILRLYLLHCSDAGDALPTMDKTIVNAVMKILCEKTEKNGRAPKAET
eukprot:NODE_269_length_12236_cov_0.516932.p7 type:complete len:194 gc:universal NODE_269_length_12236_cov_0.516932:6672-6091(-)